MRNAQRIYAIGGVGVFVALVASAVYIVGRDRQLAEKARPAKRYEKVLAEGVTLNRHGVYGVDFLRVGSAKIEKMRRGPIRLGAFNTLVLTELEIVIPIDGLPGQGKGESGGGEGGAAKKMFAAGDGAFSLDPATLKFLNPDGTSFSSVSIDGMKVSRQTKEGVVPLFAAVSAKSHGDALELSGCVVFEDGATNAVHGAKVRRCGGVLTLEWDGGAMQLENQAFLSKTESNRKEE